MDVDYRTRGAGLSGENGGGEKGKTSCLVHNTGECKVGVIGFGVVTRVEVSRVASGLWTLRCRFIANDVAQVVLIGMRRSWGCMVARDWLRVSGDLERCW